MNAPAPDRGPRNVAMLWIATTVAAAGGVLGVVAARSTWAIVRTPGRSVAIDAGTVTFPSEDMLLNGADVGGAIVDVLPIVALVAALAMFLVGPRVRMILAVGAAVAGAVMLAAPLDRVVEAAPPQEVVRGAGAALYRGAGLVALFGAGAAIPVARSAPRIGMPERAPSDPGVSSEAP